MSSFAHSEHRRRPLYLTSGNGFENSMAYCFGSQLGNISPKTRNIKLTKNEEKRTQKSWGLVTQLFQLQKVSFPKTRIDYTYVMYFVQFFVLVYDRNILNLML